MSTKNKPCSCGSGLKQKHCCGTGADPNEMRFKGRTLKIEILVNTDDQAVDVAERVNRAARGPRMDMSVVSVGEVPAEAARSAFEMAFAAQVAEKVN